MILTDEGIASLVHCRDAITDWLRYALGLPCCATPAIQPMPESRGYSTIRRSIDEPRACLQANGLSAEEQRARVIALRGMSQAREGDFAAAEETFVEAVTLDPQLDLRRLPSFWQLPRQIHEAAIGALLSSGRSRDASELIADLKTRFRPRVLPRRGDD